MNIKIQSVHFTADKKLEDFIEQKIAKLFQLSEQVLSSEVILKLDKSEDMENKVTEIKLNIPGNDLFAKKQAKTFEEATDSAVEALRRQLIKQKDKTR